jgi:hypothetical protein
VGCLALLVAGCVSLYKARNGSGAGWEEERLDEDTVLVAFYGAGGTPRGAVYKYFLHRCAEITLQRGYAYFELFATGRPAADADSPFIKVRGARVYVPSVVVVPGATVTTYRVTAIVRMYPKDLLGTSEDLFAAHDVIRTFGAEVAAGNPTAELPSRFRKVEGQFPVLPAERARAPGARPADGPVHLDDLKDLMNK